MTLPPDVEICSCPEALALRAELELLRATLEAQDVCWHCRDCLEPIANVCDRCPQPGDCDDEDCQAEGCRNV